MRFFVSLILCVSSSAWLAAQDNQPPASTGAPASSPSTQSSTAKTNEDQQMKIEQSQRMVVVPMFSVTSRPDARPLTGREKFHLWAKAEFDPFQGAALALQAGLSQWQDEFPEYGQGAVGYGKRFGASFADSTTSGFFSDVIYPVLLKQDPRFFRMGQGGFRKRFAHSVTQAWYCHTDHGTRQPNFSNFLGAMTSGAISNIYYPPSDRGFALTMSRSAISLAYGSAGGVFSEFGPDLQAKLLHRHRQAQ